jgi:hypothetical protein
MYRADWKRLAGPVLVTGAILGSALSLAQHAEPTLPEDMADMRFVHALVVNDPTSPLFGFHHFYVNERGIDALARGGPYPEGTVFLGLAYELKPEGDMINEGRGKAVFLMAKDPSARETGGWRFAQFDPAGNRLEIDAKSACFECHTQVADRDYVFSRPLGVGALSQVWVGRQSAGDTGSTGEVQPQGSP